MTDTVAGRWKGIVPRTITTNQAKDTGMAMVLICLIVVAAGGARFFFGLAIILLLLDMIWPNVFRPVAKIWLGLSNLLGALTSRLVLAVVFLVLVFPVGLVRRLAGKDSLKLKEWKKDHSSVFKTRDHDFTAEDIKHPY